MKDWLKSPEPEAMMGPKLLDGLDDADESAFELLPPPAKMPGQENQLSLEPVKLPSLKDVCRRILFRNVAAIEDLGDMPFSLVQDVLEVMRPDKLQNIEASSPHLAAHTDYIWKRHVLAEFPKFRKAYEKGDLPEPTGWHTQYLLCGEERERELDHLGSKLKERYAEANQQRTSRKMVITERAPVQIGRRFAGTSAAGSGGFQSKGSKILNRARGQALRLRGPRRTAPVQTVGDAHIPFLSRWNPPAKNTFEGAAFTTPIAPPPKPPPARPVAPRPSTSTASASKPNARATATSTLPPSPTAPPVLNFFGASTSKVPRSSSKRPKSVVTVSVQKKRKVQSSGWKGSGNGVVPLSSPPHSASSPASSAGSPTLLHPGASTTSWSPNVSPASPSSVAILDDPGTSGTSKGLDFFSSCNRRSRSATRTGMGAAVPQRTAPESSSSIRMREVGVDSACTLPPKSHTTSIPTTTPAALYARANGQSAPEGGNSIFATHMPR